MRGKWFILVLLAILFVGCGPHEKIPQEKLNGTWYSQSDFNSTMVEFSGDTFSRAREFWLEPYQYEWKEDTVFLTGYYGSMERILKEEFEPAPGMIVDSVLGDTLMFVQVPGDFEGFYDDILVKGEPMVSPEIKKIGYSVESYLRNRPSFDLELHRDGTLFVSMMYKRRGWSWLDTLSQRRMDSIWEAVEIARVPELKPRYCCSGHDGGTYEFAFHHPDSIQMCRVSGFDVPGRMQKLIYHFVQIQRRLPESPEEVAVLDTVYAHPTHFIYPPTRLDSLGYFEWFDSVKYATPEFKGGYQELEEIMQEWVCEFNGGNDVDFQVNKKGRMEVMQKEGGGAPFYNRLAEQRFDELTKRLHFSPARREGKPVTCRFWFMGRGCDTP